MRSRSAIALAIISLLAIGSVSLLGETIPTKGLQVSLATDKNSKAATRFSADVPTIYAFWRGDSFEIGDKIKAVWIAEDVGNPESTHTKIREAEAAVYKHQETGEFSLSRPANQVWPAGRYSVEFYINDRLTEVVKFTIDSGSKTEMH